MPEAPPNGRDQEFTLPRAEALLAGTLALMTVQCRCQCERQRAVMAQKIARNLEDLEGQLRGHPHFSGTFQAVVCHVRKQWTADTPTTPVSAPQPDRRLWHTTDASVH